MKVIAREKDNFWYYSCLFDIPLNLLLEANQHLDPACLMKDDEVNIPGYETISYCIKEYDTIESIASEYEIAPEILVLTNNQKTNDSPQIGESISLPIKCTYNGVCCKKRYDSKQLNEDILTLSETIPFITVAEIGKSVLGKSLPIIKIGYGRKKVQINASFHANEWITSAILMDFVHEFLISLINKQPIMGIDLMSLYNSVELTLVPMVNPDGVDLVLNGPEEDLREKLKEMNEGIDDYVHWKANINGVDLNNQFPANWVIEKKRKEPKKPAPRDYPGDEVLTEPEAIAMAELAKKEIFHRMIAIHTQGKEFYWGYEGYEPDEASLIAVEYERLSGYKAIRYVDSHAGYKDWFIQEFNRPAFTLELGKGINPLPLSQYEEIYRDIKGIFLAAMYM